MNGKIDFYKSNKSDSAMINNKYYDDYKYYNNDDKYYNDNDSLYREIDFLKCTINRLSCQDSAQLQTRLDKAEQNIDYYKRKNDNNTLDIKNKNKTIKKLQRQLKLIILAASRFDMMPKLKNEISKIKDEEKNVITFKKFFENTSNELEQFDDDLIIKD